jgi:hypothetical protein
LNRPLTNSFDSDASIEARFYRVYKSRNPSQPERALMFAVLSEAVETFQKFAFTRSVQGQALFDDAKRWIWDGNSDYLFSFKSICDLMGLDPALLRRGLIEWTARRQESRKQKPFPSAKPAAKKRRTSNRAPGTRRRFRSPRLKGGWLT